MIHVFEACGQKMALDVGSGAVHVLDDLAFDALSLGNRPRAELEALLSRRHDRDAVCELLDELESLRREGQLDVSETYDESVVLQPGVVKAMCLHAAHDCNLRCQYCFASQGDYHSRNRMLLPVETGKAALDWLVAHSGKRHSLEVDFFGGEPLMNLDAVRQIVAYGRTLEQAHDKRFSFTITTNAVGLDDGAIAFINEEMDNVVLSIDGRREVHDRMRPTPNGRGSYDLTLPNAQKLAETRGQQRYYVRGTFTAYNTDFAQDVLALAQAGFEQISIEPVVAEPGCGWALTQEHMPQVMAEYERLAEAYLKERREGKWFNFFHFMVDLSGGPCLRKRLTGCGAGNEYVAVTPEGDIYPCHQFVGREGFRMGSVLDGAFDRDLQARFAASHVLSKPACRTCWARFFCSGGCAANAHQMNGSIDEPYDLACQMQKKRLECALAIYAIERGDV